MSVHDIVDEGEVAHHLSIAGDNVPVALDIQADHLRNRVALRPDPGAINFCRMNNDSVQPLSYVMLNALLGNELRRLIIGEERIPPYIRLLEGSSVTHSKHRCG